MQKAIQLNPSDPKYYYNLALIKSKQNDSDGALAILEKAIQYGADNPATYQYISNLYVQLGQNDKAEYAMEIALQSAPLDVDLLKQYSDILVKNGRWSKSIETLKKIMNTSVRTEDRAEALFNLGQVYMQIGDYENSRKALEASNELNSGNEDSLIALGNLYHVQGDSHKSIDLYKKALRINPDSVPVLKALGILYYKLQLFTEAEQILRSLLSHPLKKEDDVSFVYQALGKIYKKRGQYDDAIRNFEKSLSSDNTDFQYESLIEISDSILKANKPSETAYEYIQKSIALKPKEYEARILLARALIKEGSIISREKAEEELTLVTELAKNPEVLSNAFALRGIMFFKEGFYLKAMDDFNLALEYNPSNQEAFNNKKATSQMIETQY
jgi:tetratricopeptide (TPR) repeat protein